MEIANHMQLDTLTPTALTPTALTPTALTGDRTQISDWVGDDCYNILPQWTITNKATTDTTTDTTTTTTATASISNSSIWL